MQTKTIKNKETNLILSEYGYSMISSGSIFLNFPIDNSPTNGCRKQCSFCYWKNFNIRLCPTNSQIEEYLKYCWGRTVSLSGGGDPLFNFQLNKKELERICNCLHLKNRKVELISTEWETIKENLDDFIISNIDCFAFSIQNKNQELLKLLKEINKYYPKEKVRLIKIYNKKETIEDIVSLYDYYKDYIGTLYIRENYYDRVNYEEVEKINDILDVETNKSHRIIFSRTAAQLVLVGRTIFDVIYFDSVLSNKEKLISLLK